MKRILFCFLIVSGFAQVSRGDFVDKLPPVPTAIEVKPSPKKSERPEKLPTASSRNTQQGQDSNASSNKSPARGKDESEGGLNTQDMFQHDTSLPLVYKAEMGGGSRKDGSIELIKNVVIVQGEMTLNADKAELYSDPNSQTPNRVVAKGNVKLVKKGLSSGTGIHAEAEEIEYFANTRKAVLKGKPKIWKGKEMLRGEVIELDIPTEGIRVKNPSGIVDPKAAATKPQSSKTRKQ